MIDRLVLPPAVEGRLLPAHGRHSQVFRRLAEHCDSIETVGVFLQRAWLVHRQAIGRDIKDGSKAGHLRIPVSATGGRCRVAVAGDVNLDVLAAQAVQGAIVRHTFEAGGRLGMQIAVETLIAGIPVARQP